MKHNPYSIGYVELIYALQNNLGYGSVLNQTGEYVDPTVDSVATAAANFASLMRPDLRVGIVNAPGPDSYPISGFTWLLATPTMHRPTTPIWATRRFLRR